MTVTEKDIGNIISLVKEKENRPVIIAIDGRAAAGKSTLAEKLKCTFSAEIIHMDDFFLPSELRTEERRAGPGGNVHYERFSEEVLPGLRSGKEFSYGVFNCSKMDIDGKRKIVPSDVIIIEGSYSLHPFFGEYADIKIFCDITPGKQLERIKKRNGETAAERFSALWIPLEEHYFDSFDIRSKADLIL